MDEEGAVNGDAGYEEGNGYYDEYGEWVAAAPGEVYDEWGNLTYKDGEEQGYYDEESGEWVQYYYDAGEEEGEEEVAMAVEEEVPTAVGEAPQPAQHPQDQAQTQAAVAAAADEAAKAADEAAKVAADAANAAAEASKNLMKGFSNFGGGLMGSLSTTAPKQKQDKPQQKSTNFGIGGLGGFGFGGGKKQEAKSPGFSFGGLGFGTASNKHDSVTSVQPLDVHPETEILAPAEDEQNGYYDETTGEWVPAAPGEVYDEWGNLTHKDGIEQGYYDEESGEWITYDEAEEYDEYGNVVGKEKEKTPDDVEMVSLHEAEPLEPDPGSAPSKPEQSPETATQAPEMPVKSPPTADQEQTQDQEVKTGSGAEEENGYYDETTGAWICAAPGEVYDEWGNLTHKDGIEQGYYDDTSGEWIPVDPAEVYDEWGNLTHKDGVEQGYYDEETGQFIPYEEGQAYDEYGNVIPDGGKEKSPEDAETVPIPEDLKHLEDLVLKQDQVVPEVQPVVGNKTAGFTARQRWFWAFDMVSKVKRESDGVFGTESRVETRKEYRSLLKTADDAMEFPSLSFLTRKPV